MALGTVQVGHSKTQTALVLSGVPVQIQKVQAARVGTRHVALVDPGISAGPVEHWSSVAVVADTVTVSPFLVSHIVFVHFNDLSSFV